MNLTKLKGKIPQSVLDELPIIMGKYKIDTPKRMAHFLGNCHHESGGFKRVEENLNYTSPERIVQIFKSDFDRNKDRIIDTTELEKAKVLAGKPKELANFVYQLQNGNGNEASGDGWNFRGRAYIQLTGRANYKAFSEAVGDDCVKYPDLVAFKYALSASAWFFSKGVTKCDAGVDYATCEIVCRFVNGGTHGLDKRIELTQLYYGLLS